MGKGVCNYSCKYLNETYLDTRENVEFNVVKQALQSNFGHSYIIGICYLNTVILVNHHLCSQSLIVESEGDFQLEQSF
ncbi:hypothetical protein SAMN06298216_1489 [Spirosomataceae bacterium TFI 002]|nr:hypothetical protein SAMN06298216_1489 [Spirosomataceae bacterium TFI 002]